MAHLAGLASDVQPVLAGQGLLPRTASYGLAFIVTLPSSPPVPLLPHELPLLG